MVADVEELEEMEASESKEVSTLMNGDNFVSQSQMEPSKPLDEIDV